MIDKTEGKRMKIESYYEDLYRIKGEKSFRDEKHYKAFVDLLPPQKGARLLDVGCGTGYLLKWAYKKGFEVYGMDISSEATRITRKVVPAAKTFHLSAEKMDFAPRFFDVITSIGVIEHFQNIKAGLSNIQMVGKDNALFLLVMPNLDYIGWLKKKRKGTNQQEMSEALYSLKGWLRILDEAGFKVLKIYKDPFIWRRIDVFSDLRPILILKRFLYKFFMKMVPIKYTYQFVFLCKKQ